MTDIPFDFNGIIPQAASQAEQGGYQFLSLDASGLSSRYCDLLSVVHDQSPDTAIKLDAFLRSVNQASWRSVASTLATLIHEQVAVDQQFVYVRPQDRAKTAIAVRTITHSAPLEAVLTAARLQRDENVSNMVSGWMYGQRDVQAVHGGFPVRNHDQLVSDIIDDHSKVKPAATIAGMTNVVSPSVHATVSKNFGMIKQDRPEHRAKNFAAFKQGAAGLEKPVVDLAGKLYAIADTYNPKYSSDAKTAQSEFVANFLQAQTAAREALKTGRESRGVDNNPAITSPWYRFKHAPKNVNRLAFILAITEGKIKSTSSAQLAKVFPVDDQGWHVHIDSDCALDILIADLEKRGLLKDFELAPRVLIQIDLLGDIKKNPLSSLLKLLQKNKTMFGWAMHDGFVFLTKNDGHVLMDVPALMMRIAVVNHLRTLNAHVPWMDLRAQEINTWFGTYVSDAKIPRGSFTGHDTGDFVMFEDKEKGIKKHKNGGELDQLMSVDGKH